MDDLYVIVVWNESGELLGSPPITFPNREIPERLAAGMRELPQASGNLIDVVSVREYEYSICPIHKGQVMP